MLFDSSLRRDLSRTFGATLVVILTIVLTMMLIRTLGQAALGRISPQDVVLMLGYFALGHLPTAQLQFSQAFALGLAGPSRS